MGCWGLWTAALARPRAAPCQACGTLCVVGLPQSPWVACGFPVVTRSCLMLQDGGF